MSKPALVAVYGNSNSGKTELVVDLIEEYGKNGLDVCTIKHSPSDTSIDERGKDSWRHREAGAKLIVFSSEVETDFILPEEMKLEDIVEKVGELQDCDLVIAEGYKDRDVPKVAVGGIEEKNGTIARFEGDRDELREAIDDELELKRIEADLPGLDCGRCGYDSCRGLAKAINEGKNDLSDCEVREEETVELVVDGEEVPLENFPALMLEKGIKGMLRSLKGVDGKMDQVSLKING